MGEYKAEKTQIGNTNNQNEIFEHMKKDRKTANNKVENLKLKESLHKRWVIC